MNLAVTSKNDLVFVSDKYLVVIYDKYMWVYLTEEDL